MIWDLIVTHYSDEWPFLRFLSFLFSHSHFRKCELFLSVCSVEFYVCTIYFCFHKQLCRKQENFSNTMFFSRWFLWLGKFATDLTCCHYSECHYLLLSSHFTTCNVILGKCKPTSDFIQITWLSPYVFLKYVRYRTIPYYGTQETSFTILL